MTFYTVQCGYAGYYAQVLSVEVDSPEEACELANDRDGWRSLDHCGDTYVDALAEGDGSDPWGSASLPVLLGYSEEGPGARVVIRVEGGTVQAVNASGGRVLVIVDDRDDGETHEHAFPEGGAS
ncbi:hypothetical protein [Parvularcula oceani]|uniref:hypothetical protein n=1 Tax=Parvularcula oceani TaxID=1247963 RepID=UPI0004E1AFFD|nr:hypothetical protein [Parvularcula oceani]